MAMMDVREEQSTKFSWFDIPYVMTLPKNPSKFEEAAKTAAVKFDGEQGKLLALVQDKINNDLAALKLWVERMKDQEAMAQWGGTCEEVGVKIGCNGDHVEFC